MGTSKLESTLSHGHSDLVRLIDEVDAHLQGLKNAGGCEWVVEGLHEYFGKLSSGLRAHIIKEETELFPSLDQTQFSKSQIEKLLRQHALMVESLDALENTISAVTETNVTSETAIMLLERIVELRTEFSRHSADERAFLHDLDVQSRT